MLVAARHKIIKPEVFSKIIRNNIFNTKNAK